ncbi:MAG: hypothetical protein AAFN92_19295, partial [Bacteroidota bacterium]
MDSKTHRAVFLTSERSDALPVNEHGLTQNSRLRKLDEIRLYTLAELNAQGSNASPLKTVHFEYVSDGDAEQISGALPNAQAGKLTLKSVSFTYADNKRGKQNPYVFSYKTGFENSDGVFRKIDYEPFMFDGWGTQREPFEESNKEPLNFPYAEQNSDLANAYCDLGNLEEIGLPSGATIAIDYEADSYAYVQDTRAGKMFSLLGFTEEFDAQNPPTAVSTELYTPNINRGFANQYTYVDVGRIPRDDNGNLPDTDELRRLYLEDVEQLYFSAIVSLRGTAASRERVSGYATFDADFLEVIPGAGEDDDQLVLRLQGLNQRNEPVSSR